MTGVDIHCPLPPGLHTEPQFYVFPPKACIFPFPFLVSATC